MLVSLTLNRNNINRRIKGLKGNLKFYCSIRKCENRKHQSVFAVFHPALSCPGQSLFWGTFAGFCHVFCWMENSIHWQRDLLSLPIYPTKTKTRENTALVDTSFFFLFLLERVSNFMSHVWVCGQLVLMQDTVKSLKLLPTRQLMQVQLQNTPGAGKGLFQPWPGLLLGHCLTEQHGLIYPWFSIALILSV